MCLAKNKLDCVEMLISIMLNSIKDGIIDHDEFFAKMKDKKYYDFQKNEGEKKSEVEIV